MKGNLIELREVCYEFRADADKNIIEGVLIRYNDEADIASTREKFLPGAFGDSAVISSIDAIANLHHERSKPIARTNGGGLTLIDSPVELRARIELPDTSDGRDARELVKRRILRGLSVEFASLKESFIDGVRCIESATLFGLGIVGKPAYANSALREKEKKEASDNESDNEYFYPFL